MSDVTPRSAVDIAVEQMLTAAGSAVSAVLAYRAARGDNEVDLEAGQAIAPVVNDERYVVTVRLANDDDVAFQETDDLGEVPPWVSGNWSAAEGSEPAS